MALATTPRLPGATRNQGAPDGSRPRAVLELVAWALLGDGHRCETWLAWDVGRWCPVAVKLPRPGQGARAVAALAREAEVAAAVAHPGVRRLLDDRLDQPLPHLVFEYVEGPTLDDALADDGRHGPVRPRGRAVRAGHRHPGLRPGRRRPARRWPQLAGPAPRARGRNPEVPAAVDRAVAALLAPDPADRPASAAQALSLLAGAMPADATEEDRLWPTWATGRPARWRLERPPPVPRPA